MGWLFSCLVAGREREWVGCLVVLLQGGKVSGLVV